MSARWRETTAVIRGAFGERTVRALASSTTPGLVITRAIGDQLFSGEWVITHASSGFAVRGIKGAFPDLKGAKAHARRLAALTDWTRTPQAIARERGLRERVDGLYKSAAKSAAVSLPGDEP